MADRSWIASCAELNSGMIIPSGAALWLHSTGDGVEPETEDIWPFDPNILSWGTQESVCPLGYFLTGFRASVKNPSGNGDRIYQIQCTNIRQGHEHIETTSYSHPMYVHETTPTQTDFSIQSSGNYILSSVNGTHLNSDRAFTIGARAACFRCNSGYATMSCTQCVAGKYTSGNRLQCDDCPANSNSPAASEGKDSCTCNAGYVSGGDFCRQCEKGKYVAGSSCRNCEPGKYSTQKGATSSLTCEPCPSGSTSPAGSDSLAEDCQVCAAGKKAVAGVSDCEPCPTAHYAAAGSTQCFPCPAGTWSDLDELGAESDCQKCAMGKYSTTEAATLEGQCKLCDVGKYSNHPGANSIETCQDCAAAPGYYCPPGSNSRVGVLCDAGHRCPGGKSDKQGCPAGTHALAGRSTCTVCVPGTYSGEAYEYCTACDSDSKTSPYKATTQSDCFAFNPALRVCPPGFWRNTTSNQCTPCTIIGDIDDYYHHWQRALRYTHFKLPMDLTGFYKEGTVTEYKNLLSAETSLHGDTDLTMPTNRFATPRDQLARSCGLTHDAVVCPHGMTADPSSSTGCKLPPPPPANNASDCLRGQYLNHATGTCTACPRNLTTLHRGAWDPSACLFCDPSFYLHVDNTTGEESCQPCHGPTSCHTTQAFGGAPAHRMTNCSIPCGPEHMHEDNQRTYQCFFSQCMHHVRAQDIHPCALGDGGRMRTNLSASRCHPYFVPVAPDWMDLVQDPDTRIYALYETHQADVPHITAVSHRKPKQAYLDWYYLFFATNVISQKLEENFGWPHLRGSEEDDRKNSEAIVFNDAKEVMGMLLAKDATRLREEAVELHGQKGGEAWPSFYPYEKVLPWTDIVRHVYEKYQKDYLQTWVDEQCNGTETRKNDDVSMYHCHMKFFARPADPLEWQVEVEQQDGESLRVLTEYQCETDNVQTQLQSQLNKHTQEILDAWCFHSNRSDHQPMCQQAVSSLLLPLGGLDRDTIDRDYFFLRTCNMTELYENFTADWNATERDQLRDICTAHSGNVCSGQTPKPWFCHHECVQQEDPLCLKFVAQRNSSYGAVLEALGPETRTYAMKQPYMTGEEALLEDVRGEFCGANQTAREALLERYSPEFPGGRLERFVRQLWDSIQQYWESSKYTCRVTFADGGEAYPCVFDKDHQDENFFRVSFVNSSKFTGGAYTLNLTKRDDSGNSESVLHRVEEREYDAHGTRPFCTVASPAEFDMVRAAAEDI